MAPADSNANRTVARVLGVVALIAVLWSAYEGLALRRLSEPLRTPAAPRGMVSLQLAPSTAEANRIVRDWRCQDSRRDPCTDVSQVAHDALARDSRFVLAYVVAWALVALWAGVAAGLTASLTGLIIAVIVAAGICDLAENWLLGLALGGAEALPFARIAPLVPGLLARVTTGDTALHPHAFTLARLAAMTKFVLLLLGIAGAVAVAGGGLRLRNIRRRLEQERRRVPSTAAQTEPETGITDFGDLIERETAGIFSGLPNRSRDYPVPVLHSAADEPYVPFRAADIIGLSLSGGGIRSATFNLGLLQGLHRLHLLRLFDYVSTVSGGGYIGAFWSAWLARRDEKPDHPEWERNLFPTTRADGERQSARVETDQERHLREFGGFLAPRWGFFEVETWTAVVALLAGLVPALLIGLSVIGVALLAWLALTFPLASHSDWAPALVVGLVTTVVLYVFERMWQEFRRETAGYSAAPTTAEQEASTRGRRRHRMVAVVAVAAVVALQLFLPGLYAGWPEGPWPIFERALTGVWRAAPDDSGLVRWWAVTGIANPGHLWIFSPRLFDYGLVWLACGLGLVLARVSSSVWPGSWRRESLAAFDRVVMRVLGMGVVWVGVALVWHVTINVRALLAVAISALISGGIFAALRNWIGVALRRPADASMTDRLKPILPPLLAYLTLALTAVTVGGTLIWLGGTDWWSWWVTSAVMTALLVLALFIKPDEFGMHAFYRDRIARAYAGASNLAQGQDATDNRGAEPRVGDELRLTALRSRPLHLVCCAANDLSGDQVETLGRGARSAVLSKHGVSLGPYARAWRRHSPGNRLGSAVTASAAAFNSNMGQISVRVGPAVSFLMTMLNLRLGLWVRHPAAAMAGPRRWPGLLYYREMMALTLSSGRIAPGQPPEPLLRDVHLSDGGHFENLALYELIRRHCRYIILSDCGADPTVAFDDLGNALRRIREDFGVDISLDVSPLFPGQDGRSRQHVAVGTIHYAPTDQGILLYVKPSITGDESPDVLQYRTRNTAFPHEATTDQFYDEAQWESYRRLGLHAAESIFAFVARADGDGRGKSADWLFAEASRHWGPTPEDLEDRVLEMTKRFGALEAELQERQSRGMLTDVFPEIAYIPADVRQVYASSAPEDSGGAASAPAVDADTAMASELAFLLRVTQLMEDVWLACRLDQWWAHPLNLGWINLFARWATSASFRFWWPLLGPMFSPGFRRFIQERFPVREDDPSAAPGAVVTSQGGHLEEIPHPRQSGLASLWWEERSSQPISWDRPVAAPFGRVFYQNVLELPRAKGVVRMQVGLATVLTHETSVGWTSDDFFVPPSLWGAGIGWDFLQKLLTRVSARSSWCHVVVKAPPDGRRHQVARDDRQGFVDQYRKIGFREARPGEKGERSPIDLALCRQLGYDEAGDTLLVLDLAQWAKRQR